MSLRDESWSRGQPELASNSRTRSERLWWPDERVVETSEWTLSLFLFFTFIDMECFQQIKIIFFIDEIEIHAWIPSVANSGYHSQIFNSFILLFWGRTLIQPHQFLFSRFISVTSCELACSNFSTDEKEMIISVPSLSKLVYDLYDFHWLVVDPIFLPRDIERIMNSFSFSCSIWLTYLHFCHLFIQRCDTSFWRHWTYWLYPFTEKR